MEQGDSPRRQVWQRKNPWGPTAAISLLLLPQIHTYSLSSTAQASQTCFLLAISTVEYSKEVTPPPHRVSRSWSPVCSQVNFLQNSSRLWSSKKPLAFKSTYWQCTDPQVWFESQGDHASGIISSVGVQHCWQPISPPLPSSWAFGTPLPT